MAVIPVVADFCLSIRTTATNSSFHKYSMSCFTMELISSTDRAAIFGITVVSTFLYVLFAFFFEGGTITAAAACLTKARTAYA
jgi:hypothetical protein